MSRTVRTLLLSAAALGALATAATAAPSTPSPLDAAPAGMASMHVAGTTSMHTSTEAMTAMHTSMADERGVHDAMLDDPTMQANCPMLTSTAPMHRPGYHHETPGGGRG